MKKRTRRRYETANQIRDDIDRFKAKQKRHMERAAALDLTADEWIKYGGNQSPEDISWNREQAKKCRRSAQRIETVKLVKLKQKLAEFQTATMTGIVSDPSIQR